MTRMTRMTRVFLVLAAAAALVYVALCVALWLGQRRLLYFPPPVTPAQLADTIAWTAPDGTPLRASARERPGPGAVIWFGGNAEDASASAPWLAEAFPARSIYTLHYRGYGGSGGAPSEAAIRADALELFDRVHAVHADVVLAGRSLGSGVALRLATQRPATRLVLLTPYDSVLALAARRFPMFPVRWMLQDRFESSQDAPAVRVPVTMVLAEDDLVVPHESSERLLGRFAPRLATRLVVPGTDHNSLVGSPALVRLMQDTIPAPRSRP